VAESQQGVAPIRAGRFHVLTPHHEPLPSAVNLIIPAAQAFGTGHHATTAGCLAMLDAMKRGGVHARNLADIGSGTGLLAFAAMHLWPRAAAIASDIDPVCAEVVRENAALNRMPLQLVVADGMDHPALQAREPFDLLIANILALPLIDLAPEFALALVPGGNLVLAGLLETQESAVRVAYRRYGFRLRRRLVKGDWSVLWLGKSRVR
ncbi:MAG: 50S ribosomal protein L11 methyltransferase, partial [Qipengyuania sp.]